MIDIYPIWPKAPPWRVTVGVSLEMPNGFFGHVGIFSEEISGVFGIGFEFEFVETEMELVKLIAIEFNEYGIEFREEDYDHLCSEIRKEMKKCLMKS